MAAKKKKINKPDKNSSSKKAAKKKILPPQKKSDKKKKVAAKVSKKKLPSKKNSKSKKVDKHKTGAGFASNNFNYIRALIWREYGLDYVSYFDPAFIKIIKDVYRDCKAFSVGSNIPCSDIDILQIYDDVVNEPNRKFPYIEEDLYLSERQYYEILNVEFTTFPSYLWIISSMIVAPPSEFVVTEYYSKNGNTDRGYKRFFKEFVDWANHTTKSINDGYVDSEDIEIYIKFTKPEFNQEKQRWETEIFICTSSGTRFSFGFVPQGKQFDHDVEGEYVEPPEGGDKKEKEIEKPKEELTPKEIEKRKKNNTELFSALLKLTDKYEQLERKVKREKEKKKKSKDDTKRKNDYLERLKKIKKEFEKSIKFYKSIGDKRRLNKALKDLDDVMKKIKKLS